MYIAVLLSTVTLEYSATYHTFKFVLL